MCKKIFVILFVYLGIGVKAQHQFTTNVAHESLVEAIRINHDVIQGRTTFFERQAEEKPLMFQKTRVLIGELNRIANNLKDFIDKIQEEVNTERVIYDLLDEDHYSVLIFSKNGKLTQRGEKLKTKIDSLYTQGHKINIHQLSQLKNFANDHFKTDVTYFDFNEKELSFFDNLFYDKSNYGMMMSMYCLFLNVQNFQLLYYGTVMSY